MATNGNLNYQEQYKGSVEQYTAPSETSSAANTGNNLSKDEVGWYFVEQYYTTLSKNPEKLHLFYSKRSQFVYGKEAEVANVSVGRAAIQDRIRELDFQDCKVRISNVDSQASFDNIVIQVIGETSNKGAEPKKFVQTFVLAQQPSGYFVLNDVLRYIDEDIDDEVPETSTQAVTMPAEPEAASAAEEGAAQEQPVPQLSVQEQPSAQLDPAIVDKKLEEVSAEEEAVPTVFTDETSDEAAPEIHKPTAAQDDSSAASGPDPDAAARELAEEDAKKTEAPKDPSPTPVATRSAAPVTAEPEKPKEPPKPMTWASRAAAAAGAPRPVVPLPKTPTPQVPASQARSQPAATPAVTVQPSEVPAPATRSANKENINEWQTAGADSKRQSRPLSISGPPLEKEGTLGYIRNVTDKIQIEDLRAALATYGELKYFDVNRQKTCAFVEFVAPAGYQAAVAANPHLVNGEEVNVEPRRPKANAYGGSNYSNNRGGLPGSGRGRGGYGGDRGGRDAAGVGSQRGAYSGLGRGGTRGGPAARGARGASQAGNA